MKQTNSTLKTGCLDCVARLPHRQSRPRLTKPPLHMSTRYRGYPFQGSTTRVTQSQSVSSGRVTWRRPDSRRPRQLSSKGAWYFLCVLTLSIYIFRNCEIVSTAGAGAFQVLTTLCLCSCDAMNNVTKTNNVTIVTLFMRGTRVM